MMSQRPKKKTAAALGQSKPKRKEAAAVVPLVKQPAADTDRQIGFFNPDTIIDHARILVAGGSGTGKSFTSRDILYHLRDRVYDCYVYSGSHDPDNPWEDHTPAKYVHYIDDRGKFPEDHLIDALSNQDTRRQIAEKYGITCPPTMIVFEDLEFMKKPTMWNCLPIRSVMFNGRWKQCFGVAAVQYIMSIDLELRGQFTYAIFMMEPSLSVRERIWKQYAGVFKTYEEFDAAFDYCTADHGCMVINRRPKTATIRDSIFQYKATDHGKFKIGAEDSWSAEIDERNRASKTETQTAGDAPTTIVPATKSRKGDKTSAPITFLPKTQ